VLSGKDADTTTRNLIRGTPFAYSIGVTPKIKAMKTNIFTTENENEAVALVRFFGECGITANRKGNVVKATGDTTLLAYLYEKFVTIALI